MPFPIGAILGLASGLAGKKSSGKGSGLLGLAGSLGSSLLTNKGALRRQRLADRENVRFWNMQNQYNHPTAQMERLRQAGLNPNLIYGSSVAGATGSAGSIAPSKAAPYNIQNPIPAVTSMAQTSSNIGLQKTQALKNMQDAATSKSTQKRIDTLLGEEAKLFKYRAKQAQATAIIEGLRANGLSEHKAAYIQSLLDQMLITKSTKDIKALEATIANEQGLRPNDPLFYREAKKFKDWLGSFIDDEKIEQGWEQRGMGPEYKEYIRRTR